MTNTEHLELRGRSWYVQLKVPKRLRAIIGKARLTQALHTRDLREANRLKHGVLAEFRNLIETANRGVTEPRYRALARAIELRQRLERASTTAQLDADGRPLDSPREEERFWITQEAHTVAESYGEETAARFLKLATSSSDVIIRDMFQPWQDQDRGHVTGQTRVHDKAAVDALLSWAGDDALVDEFAERSRAGGYVTHLLGAAGIARKTAARHLSHLAAFWDWLAQRGAAGRGENPWRGHGLFKKSKRGLEKRARHQWEDGELVRLMTGRANTRYLDVIHDLVRLALISGARIEELCALKKDDVERREDGWWVIVRQGKTTASVREIPIPTLGSAVLDRRTEDVDEPVWLFGRLIPGGPDGKRSWHVTKAFGRYRKDLGFTDEGKVFHSLRHTYAEALEAAEVPPTAIRKLMGHSRKDILGESATYTRGERLRLRQYVERLEYSPEVMSLIAAGENTP